MDFCNVVSATVGYSVRSLTPEPAQPGDCVVVTTIGKESELGQVQNIWDFVMREVPQKRKHCKRFRMLVFCKVFWRRHCNVTFDSNVGLECLAPLVVAGDHRFKTLVQDAMISVPANTVRKDHPNRIEKLRGLLQFTGAERLAPYTSTSKRNHDGSQWTRIRLKGGLLDPARPQPLAAWVRTHFPASAVRLAVNSTWVVENSNGIFMASSQAVFKHHPQAYARLANTLTGKVPEACHYLERTWRYLFGQL